MNEKVGYIGAPTIGDVDIPLRENLGIVQLMVKLNGIPLATLQLRGVITNFEGCSAQGIEVEVTGQKVQPGIRDVMEAHALAEEDHQGPRDTWAHKRINKLDEKLDTLSALVAKFNGHTHVITPAINPYETGGPISPKSREDPLGGALDFTQYQ